MSNKQNKPPLFLLYIAMLTVLMIILLSLTLSNCSNNQQPKPTNKATQSTETFTYTITHTDETTYTGKAVDGSNTGIFLTNADLQPNETLSKGDIINVTFPADEHEIILNIEKVN